MRTSFAARALAAGLLLVAGACKNPDARIEPFALAWEHGDFAGAEREIDALIAVEAGVEPSLVTDSRGLDEAIDAASGDTFLFLLEKSQTRLAQDDLDASIDLMRRARDVLGERFNESDVSGWLQSAILDDTVLDYLGADYEHVLVPALLAIVDLLEGGQDSYAYALQVGEVQEQILGSSFGENMDEEGNGYNPRKTYQRLSVGAYVEGIVRERESYTSEALKAYQRARDWGAAVPVVLEACERTDTGRYAPPAHGVVHVFFFGGRGPRLVQGSSEVTEAAYMLATWTSLFADNIGTLGQAPIPVPVVLMRDPVVPPLEVRVNGELVAESAPILDVNAVAMQQLDANMPWILARAVIRRAGKAVAAKAAQDSAGSDTTAQLFAGLFTNLLLTIGEKADTRNWTSLPAQLHAARFELPEGEHELDFGHGMFARVRIASGKDTIVVVVQPDLAAPGAVIVDVWSRVHEVPEPEPEPEEAPAPEAAPPGEPVSASAP